MANPAIPATIVRTSSNPPEYTATVISATTSTRRTRRRHSTPSRAVAAIVTPRTTGEGPIAPLCAKRIDHGSPSPTPTATRPDTTIAEHSWVDAPTNAARAVPIRASAGPVRTSIAAVAMR